MKLSKRMLAVLCTLLMLASCFALPYGALAAEEEVATKTYPNADPSEPYYVVGRLQEKGEKAESESKIVDNNGSDKERPIETHPNMLSGGGLTVTADQAIDFSGWDTSTLAFVVDITVSRVDGKIGDNALSTTGNQMLYVQNGATNILQATGAPYLTAFTTGYNNRAGEVTTYVIPFDYIYNGTAIKKSDVTKIDRLYWSVYNDSWKTDINGDGIFNDAYALHTTIENARVVDLSRDGEGYLNGLAALYEAGVYTKKSTGSYGNGWYYYSANAPVYSNITDITKGNYELLFDAKAGAYGYLVAKPLDENGEVTVPDSSLSADYGTYGIAKFDMRWYENYADVPAEDVSYIVSANPAYLHNGWNNLNNITAKEPGTANNKRPVLTSDWTSYTYDIDKDFPNITGAAGKVEFHHFNDNFFTVNGKRVNFTARDNTFEVATIGKNDPYYCLPTITSVRNVRIVDADIVALNKAVKASVDGVYDATYATALNAAKTLLLGKAPAAKDVTKALNDLAAGKIVYHPTEPAVSFPSIVGNKLTGGTNWRGASTPWGEAYADLTDGDVKVIPAGSYTYTKDGEEKTKEYAEVIRGVIGANRYMIVEATMPSALADRFTKTRFQLRSPNGEDMPNKGGTERRTDDYTINVTNDAKTVNSDGTVTVSLKLLLDASGERFYSFAPVQIDWRRVGSINMWFDFSGAALTTDEWASFYVNKVEIIDETAQQIEADLKEVAEGYFVHGKYTAESTKDYVALKEQAQKLLVDDSATLQEKAQLVANAKEAKAKFVPVVTEYVQFGEPDTVVVDYVNTASPNDHGDKCVITKTNAIAIPEGVDLSNLQMRVDLRFTRQDDGTSVDQSIVNRGWLFRNASNAQVGTQYNWGTGGKGFVNGEWKTVYIDMTNFGLSSVADLANIEKFRISGWNDTKAPVRIEVRNAAIVDPTNVTKVEDLKNLFADVTNGGAIDFTPDSYAAYKEVYDEWYDKAYATVDLTQYEAAKAALEEAYKGLVCVDKTVMTFSTHWCKGWDSNGTGFYANWGDADQGTVDTSIRNQDNLVIRFDISVTAKEGYTLPETLTTRDMRLAVRKWRTEDDQAANCACGGSEHSFEFPNKIIPSLDPTKVNSIEVPFTAKTRSSNTDGLLKSIILRMEFEELSGADKQYVFTISNARIEDVTKDNMAADLKAEAETTLDAMGTANGCVYDDATAGDFKAAQAAALEALAKEDPTYAELTAAQAAIDAGKAKLVVIGHDVMTFTRFAKDVKNFMYTDPTGVYMNWTTADQGKVDLTKYNKENLVLRINFYVGTTDAENYPVPATVTLNNQRLAVASNVAGEGEKSLSFSGYNGTYDSQNGVIEIPLTNATDGGINWKNAENIIWFVKVAEFANDTSTSLNQNKEPNNNSGHYYINATSARVVDTTAEKNLGSKVNDEGKVESMVKVEGSGRVDISGGLIYGKDDVLTATNVNPASKFVGWKKNDSFVKANGEDDTLNLPVNGKQNVTAYFAEEDEVVVAFLGKYRRVVEVKVVKKADAANVTFPDLPEIKGYTATWMEDDLAAAIEQTEDRCLLVTSNYTADEVTAENGYTVTLSGTTNDDATAGYYYGFDQSVKVTANVPAGMQFSHWMVNNSIAGYTDTLTVYVSGTMTIAAVYVAEDVVVEQKLSASITQNQMVENGSAYNFEVIAQTYLPEGYDLMAYGVIFAPKEETLTELKATGATEGATLDVVSSSNIKNRQYKITLEKVTAGRTRSAMAYITARNADGKIVTVYSDPETKVAQ